MNAPIDWDRLARYVTGEASSEERREVELWARATPVNREALETVKRQWQGAQDRVTWDVDRAWMRLHTRIDVDGSASPVVHSPRNARTRWRAWGWTVPVVAAAALAFVIVMRGGPESNRPDDSFSVASGATLRTGTGEQRTVRLPDGSTVDLGAMSSLRLGDDFGSRRREVHLEGQAFLRVTHDASRPFVVIAGGTRTVDLGTAFEVRTFPNEGVRVAVTEGSVEVQRTGTDTSSVAVLVAGDIARLQGTTAQVMRQQDLTAVLSWTRGELIFHDTPLRDFAEDLQRWFDVECQFETPEIGQLHFTGQLRIGDPLDEILKVVDLSLGSLGVKTERNGRTVRFRAGLPDQPAARHQKVPSEVGA